MIKNRTVLEWKVGERLYEFHCQPDSPLGEIHDALMQFKGTIVDKMIAAHQAEAAEAEKQMEEEQMKEEPAAE